MARVKKLPHCRGFGRSFNRVFLLTLVVTALAKGAALLPGYSIDDYQPLLRNAPSFALLLLKKGGRGRFGSALLNWCLHLLQLEPAHSRFFFTCCSIAGSALFAALVVRYWSLEKNRWLAVAMACIVANHPFTAEIFTFRLALGIAIFPFAILSLLLIPRRWSPRLVLAGSALFAVALSFYQMVLPYGLMIVVAGAATWLTRYLVLGNASGWPQRVVSLLSVRRLARHRNTALLGCILLGTALYTALTFTLALALRVQLMPRTQILPVHQWGERARGVVEELKLCLIEPNPLLSHLTQGMLLLVLLSALVGLCWRTRSWFRRARPSLLVLSIVALLFASLVWSLGALLFLAEFWPSPRVMAHVGIFWAGTLAVSYQCFGPRVRVALTGLSVLIVLAFIGSNNRIFDEQRRLNARDAYKANRIVARLETAPGFLDVRLVAVDGVAWTYPLRVGTLDHDLNVSAFGAEQAKADILAEVSGYDLVPTEDEAQIKAAAAYCRGVDPWPGPRSVTIEDRLAIVCLGPG
ncbi:MAG TPA: glucosyltransferase domain-containing protein [Thermoanaerobaculia bacterium]|jgi:hypothetical protein|nr:glucosyltransferase domain-containing protein [Thermoanaerobaculia bacterium]